MLFTASYSFIQTLCVGSWYGSTRQSFETSLWASMAYIRAVGTFASRYRIDSLEYRLVAKAFIANLQHRIGGLEYWIKQEYEAGNLQHRTGGLYRLVN